MNKRDKLLYYSLSTNSWKLYRTAWRSYSKVLAQLGISAQLPLRENFWSFTLLPWPTGWLFLPSKRIYRQLSTYIFSVDIHWSICFRIGYDLFYVVPADFKATQDVGRGVFLSLLDLESLSLWVVARLSIYDARLFCAVFTLAFFGLLRVSEFTCSSVSHFNPNIHLQLRDVLVDHTTGLVRVLIKVSKSDPFRQGAVIRLSRTTSFPCPFQAMVSFLELRRSRGPGPLFILSNGQFLTRQHVLVLEQVFPFVPAGHVGSHSFRIGGATRLCSLGIPEATIQILGRWSSSAFKKYLHLTDQYIASLQDRMSRR